MKLKATIDSKKLLKSLGKLQSQATKDDFYRGLEKAAEYVVSQAQKKAPKDLGGLANSDFVGRSRKDRSQNSVSVKLGFNSGYARIMDTGWKVKRIRPKKAKRLFVPISRRGRRVGPTKGRGRKLQNSTGRGGLVYGVDFLLLKEVKTPAARVGGHIGYDGEKKGPNLFFSDTLKKAIKSRKIETIVGRHVRAAIKRRAKP